MKYYLVTHSTYGDIGIVRGIAKPLAKVRWQRATKLSKGEMEKLTFLPYTMIGDVIQF